MDANRNMDCSTHDPTIRAMDRPEVIITIHLAQRKCFTSTVLLVATLLIEIGGYTVRGFILAKEALRERKERIREKK